MSLFREGSLLPLITDLDECWQNIPFNSSPVLNCGHWSRSTQVVETSVIYNVYFKCQLQIKLNWFNLPNCYWEPFRNKSPGLSDLTSAALLTRTHISIIFLYRKDDQISLITNKKAKRTNYIRIQKKNIKIGRSTMHVQMFSITQQRLSQIFYKNISIMANSKRPQDQMNTTFFVWNNRIDYTSWIYRNWDVHTRRQWTQLALILT